MMTLGDLLFVVNDNTIISVYDNETGEVMIESISADDMSYYGGGFVDCVVMDVFVENNEMGICIEV